MPCRIVLAEDNPADVELVRHTLREHKIQCDLQVLPDGEKALSFIRELDRDLQLPCPDLFLLDLYLPKHDGREVLKHLRASERCSQSRVVVLSSSDAPRDLMLAEQNAVRYFRKPFSVGQFIQLGGIIKDVLAQSPDKG